MLTVIYHSAQKVIKDMNIMLHALCKKAKIDPTKLDGFSGAATACLSPSPAPSTSSSMGNQLQALGLGKQSNSRLSQRSSRSGSSSELQVSFLSLFYIETSFIS